jgi:hypothetical protein
MSWELNQPQEVDLEEVACEGRQTVVVTGRLKVVVEKPMKNPIQPNKIGFEAV